MPRTHKRVFFDREYDFPDSGVWHHVKSSHQYVVLFPAVIEAIVEPGVAYSGKNGLIWVRPVAEFLDGRFV